MVNWLQCSSKSSCGTVAAANGSVLLAFLKGCFHGIAAMLRLASADSSLATAEVFELFVEVLVFDWRKKLFGLVCFQFDIFGEASWFCEQNSKWNYWRLPLPSKQISMLSSMKWTYQSSVVLFNSTKGQLISKCPFCVHKSSK